MLVYMQWSKSSLRIFLRSSHFYSIIWLIFIYLTKKLIFQESRISKNFKTFSNFSKIQYFSGFHITPILISSKYSNILKIWNFSKIPLFVFQIFRDFIYFLFFYFLTFQGNLLSFIFPKILKSSKKFHFPTTLQKLLV